jgi:hypothetical protein
MFNITSVQKNNWRSENPHAFGDQVDRSLQWITSLGNDKRTSGRFSWAIRDDLRAIVEPVNCRQYKPCDFLAIKPLHWDEIIDEDDDDNNWGDPGASGGARSRLSDGNNNDDGEGEEGKLGGEKWTGKEEGRTDGKGKGKGKGKAMKKGKGKGNGKGKGTVQPAPRGDDISHAVACSCKRKCIR